jgi:DNA-directed RNA polymerase subunit L
MEVKVLKNEKDYLEIEIDNLTIAELLRNQLWKDSAIEAAAWRREHPTKNPVLIVKTKGKSAKKALQDCISQIDKLNNKILEEFKKAVK